MDELKDIVFLATKATKTTDLRKLQRLLTSIELMVKSARIQVLFKLKESEKKK